MACILEPECNFMHGYFRCLLPEETMDVEVRVKMIRGIHTFRRDHTTQIISCNPWSLWLHPYPSLIRKMKTYLELEGKLGTQLHASTYPIDKNSLPWKTPVPNKVEKKKRAKVPVQRRFKLILIEQSLPINVALPINSMPTVVTTTATSTQTSAVKPMAITSNPTPLPVTIYNLVQSRI